MVIAGAVARDHERAQTHALDLAGEAGAPALQQIGVHLPGQRTHAQPREGGAIEHERVRAHVIGRKRARSAGAARASGETTAAWRGPSRRGCAAAAPQRASRARARAGVAARRPRVRARSRASVRARCCARAQPGGRGWATGTRSARPSAGSPTSRWRPRAPRGADRARGRAWPAKPARGSSE